MGMKAFAHNRVLMRRKRKGRGKVRVWERERRGVCLFFLDDRDDI